MHRKKRLEKLEAQVAQEEQRRREEQRRQAKQAGTKKLVQLMEDQTFVLALQKAAGLVEEQRGHLPTAENLSADPLFRDAVEVFYQNPG